MAAGPALYMSAQICWAIAKPMRMRRVFKVDGRTDDANEGEPGRTV